MLPSIWLVFEIWFVWASPGFVHSDDSSKKVVTFTLIQVQQGLHSGTIVALRKFHGTSNALQFCGNPECRAKCDILPLPLLTHAKSIGYQHPTRKQWVKLCCSRRGVILYGDSPERHPCLPRTLWPIVPLCDIAMLHRHMLRVFPEIILVYYNLVPLQFWSRNVVLVS